MSERLFHKNKIAVFVNGWSTEFISLVLPGICERARNDGVDVFIYTSFMLWGSAEENASTKLNLMKMMEPSDYDAVIVLANTFNSEEETETLLKRFKGSGVPMLSVEARLPGMAYVGTGNHKGMYELGRHLITEHDVKNVIYVRGVDGNEECAERRAALEEALAESGLTIMDTLDGQFGFYNAANAVNEYINAGKLLPDAFVCANDLMALGVVSKLNDLGYNVPEDVIVTGFDHISDAQTSYPLIATVSRQWESMGGRIYDELLKQIANPDPAYECEYDSVFVPTESCGCEPDAVSKGRRFEKLRGSYNDAIHNDMVEFLFQELRVAMTRVGSKKQFHEIASSSVTFRDYLGDDYCICTDSDFFALGDDEYKPYLEGYPKRMEVLFQRIEGNPAPQRMFDEALIYPDYKHKDGVSDTYVITPLAHMEYSMGYIAIKNRPEVLYGLRFKKWINNMDTLLLNVRQYMLLQSLYQRLNNIYMTDYLTDMYNRTGCEDVLFKYIESERAQGRATMLIFTDIDRMKAINDEYGHINGDLAIKATAEAMRASLPEGFLTGRFGGDEFIAVGPDDGRLTIEQYRDNFQSELREVIEDMKAPFELTASSGCRTITPDSTGTIEDYIRSADASMYEQKEIAHNKARR